MKQKRYFVVIFFLLHRECNTSTETAHQERFMIRYSDIQVRQAVLFVNLFLKQIITHITAETDHNTVSYRLQIVFSQAERKINQECTHFCVLKNCKNVVCKDYDPIIQGNY